MAVRLVFSTALLAGGAAWVWGGLASAPAAAAGAAPVVASVSPASGPIGGGTQVTITGSGFTGATAVTFGSAGPGTSLHVNSDTSVTVTSPARSSKFLGNTVDVTVTTPNGTSSTSTQDEFTYTYNTTSSPAETISLTSPSPASDYVPLGTNVTVTASDPSYTGAEAYGISALDVSNPASPVVLAHTGSATSVSSSPIAKSSFTVARYVGELDACTGTPPCPTGPVGLVSQGAVSSPVTVIWEGAPTITAVAPATGPTAGGTSVTITGANFAGASSVMFGSTAAANFVVTSPTSIVATSPPGTSTVDITVTTPIGTSATVPADRFTPVNGYDMVGSDGGVFVFPPPNAPGQGFFGSLPGLGIHVNDIVGIVATPSNKGYWLVSAAGAVYAFGDATYSGRVSSPPSPIVAIAGNPSGTGYWLVAANGKVYGFGGAASFGDLPSLGVNVADIVGMVPTSDGKGYLLVGADGGLFAFGDAVFLGSLPGLGVHVSDVVGAVPTT
ncbi:MAG TPA: IPT/TIG domain-containing protein [Acidimicrobiales bacterium]|nr:IPT/TIG domain-containing protein [Acidimicrobiales bacterium]